MGLVQRHLHIENETTLSDIIILLSDLLAKDYLVLGRNIYNSIAQQTFQKAEAAAKIFVSQLEPERYFRGTTKILETGQKNFHMISTITKTQEKKKRQHATANLYGLLQFPIVSFLGNF